MNRSIRVRNWKLKVQQQDPQRIISIDRRTPQVSGSIRHESWEGNFRGQRDGDIPMVEFNGGGKSCSLTRWS